MLGVRMLHCLASGLDRLRSHLRGSRGNREILITCAEAASQDRGSAAAASVWGAGASPGGSIRLYVAQCTFSVLTGYERAAWLAAAPLWELHLRGPTRPVLLHPVHPQGLPQLYSCILLRCLPVIGDGTGK